MNERLFDSSRKKQVKKLNEVFDCYQREYNLTTRADITWDGLYCQYNEKTDWLGIGIDFLIWNYLDSPDDDLIKRVGSKDEDAVLLFALLHEICHAIERDKIKLELQEVNVGLYLDSREYHHSICFEKRADEFARRELKRWIK